MSENRIGDIGRLAILAGGLVAGLALYLLADRRVILNLDVTFGIAAFFFFAGHSLMLLAHQGTILRSALWAGGLGLGLGLLAYQYAAHVGYGAGLTQYSDALPDFNISVWFAYFLVITFSQTWREAGRAMPYAALFQNAWHNFALALLPLPLIGLVFAALFLANALFHLIGLNTIKLLLDEAWFCFGLAGLLYALVIIYLRERDRIIAAAMGFGLAMFRIVGLVVCAASLAFLLCLPFMGLDALWDSRHAASILMGIALIAGFYINAYVEAGDGAMWQAVGRTRRIVVTATVIPLPAFVLLGAYAFYLRIGDYGWTPDRVYAVPVIGLGLLCALGYLIQVIRFRMDWTGHVAPVNIMVAAAAIVAALGIQLAPFSAYRIAANSQVARLTSGQVKADDFDFAALKFRTGAPGRDAFNKLVETDETLKALGYTGSVADLRASDSPYGISEWAGNRVRDPEDIDLSLFILLPEGTVLDADEAARLRRGMASMRSYQFTFESCSTHLSETDEVCYLWPVDLGEAGRAYLFFAQSEMYRHAILMRPIPDQPGRWATYDVEGDWSEAVPLGDLITAGKAMPVPHELPDLMLGGKRYEFDKSGEHGAEEGEGGTEP